MVDVSAIKKNRVQVVIMLIALPLLSVGAGWVLFYLQGNVTLETTNQGTFVDGVTVAELELQDPDGTVMHEGGSWWIWMVDEQCASACEETLAGLRQLHVRLNKDAPRVRRALVAENLEVNPALREHFPELVFLKAPAADVLERGVYIVDPIGNVVFRYPARTPPQPVLNDLQRLLKVSQIG